MKKIGLIVVAGGASRRYGAESGRSKLLELLDEKPVFVHCLLELSPICYETVLVIPSGNLGDIFRTELQKFSDKLANVKIAAGGMSRMESVQHGIEYLSENIDFVAIHDAARPLANKELLLELVEAAGKYMGAVPGHVMADSMKLAGEDKKILKPVAREQLYAVSTPQVFPAEVYRKVLQKTTPDPAITDDAEMMRLAGVDSVIVNEKRPNIKLTVKEDLPLLEFYLDVIKADYRL